MSGPLLFEKLSQTLVAGQVWPLHIAANEFRIVAATWPVSIDLYKGGRKIGATVVNVLAGDYVRGVEFDEIRVTSAQAQTITVMLSSGGAGSDRITGAVQVINGEILRVQSSVAFSSGGGVAGDATHYAAAQLWNLPGSGKNLIVSKISAALSPIGSFSVFSVQAAMTSPSILVPICKNLSSPGSAVAQFQLGLLTAFPAGPSLLSTQTQSRSELALSEPIIVPPGYGLLWAAGAVSETMWADVQFFEDPVLS